MRILYVTTIAPTMEFFYSYIKELIDAGHTVAISSNLQDDRALSSYY